MVCVHVIKLFNPPLAKRYSPVITINDPFPICIYVFELFDNKLMQEVMMPSTNTFEGKLKPEMLCFAVPL